MKKVLTLIEITIMMVLVSVVILAISATALFFVRNIRVNAERYNIYGQINYTLEDMKLRFLSASCMFDPDLDATSPCHGSCDVEGSVDDDSCLFDGSNGDTKEIKTNTKYFRFRGEDNIHTVTFDDLTDNATYTYERDTNGNLVLLKNGSLDEVLIDAKYNPQVTFQYTAGEPTNVIKVTITAESIHVPFAGTTKKIYRVDAIRFLYIDVVK